MQSLTLRSMTSSAVRWWGDGVDSTVSRERGKLPVRRVRATSTENMNTLTEYSQTVAATLVALYECCAVLYWLLHYHYSSSIAKYDGCYS